MEKFFERSQKNSESLEISRWKGHLEELIKRAILAVGLAASIGAGLEAQARPRGQGAKPAVERKLTGDELYDRYRRNFELMEAEVDSGRLKEKVGALRQKYGGAINNFMQIRRLERDLDSLEKVENNKEDRSTFIGDSPYIMTLGSIVSGAYETRWQTPSAKEEEFKLEALAGIPGFDEAKLNEFLAKYPREYLKGSLSGIKYEPKINIRNNMEILGEAKGYDMDSLLNPDTRTPVTIYDTSQGVDMDSVLEVFEHELGHANDWQNNHLLTSAERINMLFEVGERVEAEDRYRSSYVESIDFSESVQRIDPKLIEDTLPEQVLRYVKASEYWAEINRAYFEDQKKFETEHPEDFKIVDKWVKILNGRLIDSKK